MKTKDYYNNRQKSLVEFSERIHKRGLRNKTLTGLLCEEILIRYLREDVPEYSFYRGQIISNDESEDIINSDIVSNQYDIIIAGKNFEVPADIADHCTMICPVNKRYVKAVIEVKKWGNPKMISENGAINSAFQIFRNKFKAIPFIFVTFRFKNTQPIWATLKTELLFTDSFCFFGRHSSRNRTLLYPWEEEHWADFKQWEYKDQYYSLIKRIKALG